MKHDREAGKKAFLSRKNNYRAGNIMDCFLVIRILSHMHYSCLHLDIEEHMSRNTIIIVINAVTIQLWD